MIIKACGIYMITGSILFNDSGSGVSATPGKEPEMPLDPAARRALEEAGARRKSEQAARRPRELGGRGGPEPTRYGDWENKGIASDF